MQSPQCAWERPNTTQDTRRAPGCGRGHEVRVCRWPRRRDQHRKSRAPALPAPVSLSPQLLLRGHQKCWGGNKCDAGRPVGFMRRRAGAVSATQAQPQRLAEAGGPTGPPGRAAEACAATSHRAGGAPAACCAAAVAPGGWTRCLFLMAPCLPRSHVFYSEHR